MWQAFVDGFSVLSGKWVIALGATAVVGLGCGVVVFSSRSTFKDKTSFLRSMLWSGSFFALTLLLRLAFLAKTFVPPYFDSVEHYRIVKELTTALENSTLLKTLPTLTSSYYHLGFHFLASLLTIGLHADSIDVILILGQVILAAIPIPIFFILRAETQSDAAAFWGMFLAGFGWYMPGFAVNWGKYPALGGLLALEVVLGYAYLISRKTPVGNRFIQVSFLVVGILISAFVHTRTVVIIVIALLSWFIAGKMRSLPRIYRYVSSGILLVGILVLGTIIQREPLLKLTLEPYLGAGIWITLTVLVLSPFVWIKFPRGAYFSLLFIFCVLAALFIPVPAWSPVLEKQTVLDRPFVEMVLYLPLSAFAGLGLAGLLHLLEGREFLPEQKSVYVRNSVAIVLIGVTSLIAIERYDFGPSDCCRFVGYDDTVAMDWLNRNVPSDARILIAGTQMNVLPSGPSAELVGTDAGIWIPALTGRSIIFAPVGMDFQSENTLEQLCQEQVDYVYVGGTSQTFNAAQLEEKSDWYKGVLFLPHVRLYQLTGCSR